MNIIRCNPTGKRQMEIIIDTTTAINKAISGSERSTYVTDPDKLRIAVENELSLDDSEKALFEKTFIEQAKYYVDVNKVATPALNKQELELRNSNLSEGIEYALQSDPLAVTEGDLMNVQDIMEYANSVFPENPEQMLRVLKRIQEDIVNTVFIDFEKGVIVNSDQVNENIHRRFQQYRDNTKPEIKEKLERNELTPKDINNRPDDYIDLVLGRDYVKLIGMLYANGKESVINISEDNGNVIFSKIGKDSFRDSIRMDDKSVDGLSELDNVARLLIRSTIVPSTSRAGYRGTYLNDDVSFFITTQLAIKEGEFDGTNHVEGIPNAFKKALEGTLLTDDAKIKLQTVYDKFFNNENDKSLLSILKNTEGITPEGNDLYTTMLRAVSSRYPIKYLHQEEVITGKGKNAKSTIKTVFQNNIGKTNTADIFEGSIKTTLARIKNKSFSFSEAGLTQKNKVLTYVDSETGVEIEITKNTRNNYSIQFRNSGMSDSELPQSVITAMSNLLQVVGISYDEASTQTFVEMGASSTEDTEQTIQATMLGKLIYEIHELSKNTNNLELSKEDNQFKSLYQLLERMADVFDRATDNVPKSSKINIDGKLEASLSLENPINKLDRYIQRINKVTDSPFSQNPFVTKDMTMDMYVRDGVKTVQDKKKGNAFAVEESFEFNVLAYADSLMADDSQGRRAIFDYAVFADKNRNSLPLVHKPNGAKFGLYDGAENIVQMTQEFHETQTNFYESLLTNLSEDLWSVAEYLIDNNIKNASSVDLGDYQTDFNIKEGLGKARYINDIMSRLSQAGITRSNIRKAVSELNLKDIRENGASNPNEIVLFDKLNDGNINTELIEHYGKIKEFNDFSIWLNNKIDEDFKLIEKLDIDYKSSRGVQKLKEEFADQLEDISNPEEVIMRKMILDWNMVSDNLLPLTQGIVFQYGNENSGFVKQTKRNVGIQSTVHPYILGLTNGIEEKSRIAVIDDPTELLQNSHGETSTQEVYDGASFSSYAQYLKQENSLGYLKQGIAGKSLYSINDVKRGVYTLRKQAEFAMSNERLRNDDRMMNLAEKMHSDPVSNIAFQKLAKKLEEEFNENIDEFKERVAELLEVDVNSLEFNDYTSANEWLVNRENSDISNDKLISLIDNSTNAEVAFSLLELDVNSKFNYYVVNSNRTSHIKQPNLRYSKNSVRGLNHFLLWEDLGGTDTVQIAHTSESALVIDGNNLMYNNASWEALLYAETLFPEIKGQYIQEISLGSATKTGQANTNDKESFISEPEYDENGNLTNPLNSYLQSNVGGGIQLTAEHDPDNVNDKGDLTAPTQAISSVAFGSRTPVFTEEAYASLAEYALRKLNPFLKLTSNATDLDEVQYTEQRNAIYNTVLSLVKRAMQSDGTVSLADVLVNKDGKQELWIKDENGNVIPNPNAFRSVPFDNGQLAKKTVATVNSALVKLGIRFKLQGGQFVVSPSTDRVYVVRQKSTGEEIKISGSQYRSYPNKYELIRSRRLRQEYVEFYDENGENPVKDFEGGATRIMFRFNLLNTAKNAVMKGKSMSEVMKTLQLASEPYSDEPPVMYLNEFKDVESIGDLSSKEGKQAVIDKLDKALQGEVITLTKRDQDGSTFTEDVSFDFANEINNLSVNVKNANRWAKSYANATNLKEKKKILFGITKAFFTEMHNKRVIRTKVDNDTGAIIGYDVHGKLVYKSYPGELAAGYHHRSKFLIPKEQVIKDVNANFFETQFRSGLAGDRVYGKRRKKIINELSKQLDLPTSDIKWLLNTIQDKTEPTTEPTYSLDLEGFGKFLEGDVNNIEDKGFNGRYAKVGTFLKAIEEGQEDPDAALSQYLEKDISHLSQEDKLEIIEDAKDSFDNLEALRRHIPVVTGEVTAEKEQEIIDFLEFRNDVIRGKSYTKKQRIPSKLKQILKDVEGFNNIVYFEDLDNTLNTQIGKIVKRESKVLEENFKVSLNTMIPRIPSQSYQSTATYRTVFFIEEGQNVIQEPVESLWRKGQDHDIDKGSLFSFTFNKDATIDTTGNKEEHENIYDRLGAPITKEASDKALLNRAVYYMYRSFLDPRNQYQSQYPIDMTSIQNSAKKSPKGKMEQGFTKNSMLAQMVMRGANMVGKDVIGVSANFIKYWSAQTVAIQKALQSDNADDLKYAVSTLSFSPVLDTISDDGKVTANNGTNVARTFANVNPKLIRRDIDTDQLETYRNSLHILFPENIVDINNILDLSQKENLTEEEQEVLEESEFNLELLYNTQDQADALESQILSAATDNAKELTLGKINASTLTTSMISAMVAMDINTDAIVEFMTSPEAETILKFAKKNIYNEGAYLSPKDVYKVIITPNKELTKQQKELKVKMEAYLIKLSGRNLNNSVSMQRFEQFNKWYLFGEETSIVSKALSINQGISADADSLMNYYKRLEVFVDTKIREKNEITDDLKIFNLQKFLSSEEYADEMIKLYHDSKEVINVLYVIKTATHFKAMMETVFVAKNMYSSLTYSWKLSDELIRDVEVAKNKPEGMVLKDFDGQNVLSFIEDLMIDVFLTNSDITYRKDGKVLSLKNNQDRKDFVEFMENQFIPDIKKDPSLSNNKFLKDFVADIKKDYETGEEYSLYKLLFNTSNTASNLQSLYLAVYRLGLKNLVNKAHEGNDIFKMLMLYNLIISRNNMSRDSFTKLMDFAIKQSGKQLPPNHEGINILNNWLSFQSTAASYHPTRLRQEVSFNNAQIKEQMVYTLMLQYGFADRVYKASPAALKNKSRVVYRVEKNGKVFYHNDGEKITKIENDGIIPKRVIPISTSETGFKNFFIDKNEPAPQLQLAESSASNLKQSYDNELVIDMLETIQKDYAKDCEELTNTFNHARIDPSDQPF